MFKISNLLIFFYVITFAFQSIYGKHVTMSLEQCIETAIQQSPEVLKHKYNFLSSYWLYKAYLAGLKPQISLQSTPIEYSSTFIKRYDYSQNIDIYRQQRYFGTSLGLSISQAVPLTGGALTFSSELNYIKNIGIDNNKQFSSVPIRLGYSQSLFGYNTLKWSKKIEPLKYKIARQKYIYSIESTILKAINYFFDLLLIQEEHEMATETLHSCDSLYIAGKERFKLHTISKADLLALEIDFINAENYLTQISNQYEEALMTFRTFLKTDKHENIRLETPPIPKISFISPQAAITLMKSNNPNILEAQKQIQESKQYVEEIKKTTGIDASFSIGIGFNKASETFLDAYSHLPRQEYFTMNINIPILDWGLGKSKRNAAKNNLEETKTTVNQNIEDLEDKLTSTTIKFNQNKELINKSKEVFNMAKSSYQIYKARFILGKEDISTITLSLNRQQEAQRNYHKALSNFWIYYYTIRTLTLYDFEKKENIPFPLNNY